jgi:hypothetical protein
MHTDDLHAGSAPPEVREADPSRGCCRLAGRTALLTAAARGIGFASAVPGGRGAGLDHRPR